MRMNKVPAISVCVSGMMIPGLCVADVLDVPTEYATIQSAIDAAFDGDTVLVDDGSYNEHIDFLGKTITVESVNGSAYTTIDGTGITTSLVRCATNETAKSVFRGFTLLEGKVGSDEINPTAFSGGGMLINSASPTVEDIVFQNCESGYGGGLYALRSGSTITNCAFNQCVATGNSGAAQVFFNNPDTGTGVTFESCSFTENFSILYGGAVHAIQGDHTFSNCNFTLNGVQWIGSIPRTDYGGSISWWAGAGATLTIENCSIVDNEAKIEGGGLWVRPGYDTVEISNTTICTNAPQNVVGRYIDLGGNTVCDCIGDFNGDGVVDGADLSVLLGFWGVCNEVDCIADLNFDGVINGMDLTILLGRWGVCPG